MKQVAITVACSLVLILLAGVAATAMEYEGSTPEDLAGFDPPAPNEVYIAVLPFWGRDDAQKSLARACTMLNLMRHGFRLAPKGAGSLASVARQTDSALRNDKELDRLSRLSEEDAARLGKALGARWVIYGEFGELQTTSKKGKLLPKKVTQIDLRFVLMDVKSRKTLYWSRVTDDYSEGSGIWPTKASTQERRLITRTLNAIFDDMAAGLPRHYTGAEVTPEEVKQLVAKIER